MIVANKEEHDVLSSFWTAKAALEATIPASQHRIAPVLPAHLEAGLLLAAYQKGLRTGFMHGLRTGWNCHRQLVMWLKERFGTKAKKPAKKATKKAASKKKGK